MERNKMDTDGQKQDIHMDRNKMDTDGQKQEIHLARNKTDKNKTTEISFINKNILIFDMNMYTNADNIIYLNTSIYRWD